MGEQWFRTHSQEGQAIAAIDGQPASVSAALDRAADLLRQADGPLIYGLSRSATPGQRAAIALAERLGAVIDTTASLCHGPSIMALQEVGEVTSTLGEIRNRADLVIFWGCHPATSHPRHAERYSVFPRGRFIPSGRSDRTIVMVGEAGQVDRWCLDPAGAKPDLIVPIDAHKDFETLSMLRMMLRGEQCTRFPAGITSTSGLHVSLPIRSRFLWTGAGRNKHVGRTPAPTDGARQCCRSLTTRR